MVILLDRPPSHVLPACTGCGAPRFRGEVVRASRLCMDCHRERVTPAMCDRCGERPKRPGRGVGLCVECAPSTDRPCQRCGEPRPPAERRGERLCPDCRELGQWRAERHKQAYYATHRKPCADCRGPKEAGHKGLYCAACREVRAVRKCMGCGERPIRQKWAKYCTVCTEVAAAARRRKQRAEKLRERELHPERVRERSRRSYRRRKRRPASERVPMPRWLPSAPFAAMLFARVERMEGGLDALCEGLPVDARSVRAWRSGDRPLVRPSSVDAIILSLGMLWWDVYDPQGPARHSLSPLEWIDAVDLASRAFDGVRLLPDRI